MKIARTVGWTAALVGAVSLAGAATAGNASAVVGSDTTYVKTAAIHTGVANGDVAVSQSTHRAYVAGYLADTISVIDTTTNTKVASFPTGHQPQGLSVDEARNVLWVAETGANAAVALDATTGEVVRTVPVTAPNRLVYDPASDKVYVTQYHESTNVVVIDAVTGELLAPIPTGPRASAIAVDPAAHRVYVSNTTGPSVSIIDTTAQALLGTVTMPAAPNELAADTSTGTVYVSLTNDMVARVDPTAASIIDSFPAPSPRGISIDSAKGYVAVTSQAHENVSVFNTSGRLLQAVPVTARTWAIDVDLDNSSLFVSALSGPNVYVLPELTKPMIDSVAPPAGVEGTAYSHSVTATGSPTITFSVSDGVLPRGLNVNPDTGLISGAPTAAGSFTFTISATNPAGTDTATYALVVSAASSPNALGPIANTGGKLRETGPLASPILVTFAGLVLATGTLVYATARLRRVMKSK